MRLSFAFGYALRTLRRDGRRSFLALICIAFGVHALVAMQLLSSAVSTSMSVPPRLALGGDVRVEPAQGPYGPPHDAQLARLAEAGVITAWSRGAPSRANLVRRDGQPRVYFVMRVHGVDPATYPLQGQVELLAPVDGDASRILAERDAVIVTRDLARKLGVRVGDPVLLAGEPGAPPYRLRVRGIAACLPDRRGDTMLYGLETAALIAGSPDVVRYSTVDLRTPGDTTALQAAGFSVTTAAAAARDGADIAALFGTMLKGAGLLGLLLGGVGVANTLQVILARRTPEIATLKTLGYRQGDLLLLFAVETGLLGVIGSIMGVAGGILVGQQLTGLLSGMESALLLEFRIVPSILASGIAVGIVTALVFGLHAIVRTSAVRPAVLLRNLPVTLDARGKRLLLVLHAVLFATILAINALVLQSPVKGALLTVGAMVTLIALGGLLLACLRVVLLVPFRGRVGIARRNLGQRPLRATFALIALFAGVFAIGMSSTVFLNGRDRLLARTMTVSGEDLFVYAARTDSAKVAAALAPFGVARHYLDVSVTQVGGSRSPLTLRGIPDTVGVAVAPGATWTGADNEVLIPAFMKDAGASIEVQGANGAVILRVAGSYAPSPTRTFGSGSPLLVNRATARALAGGGGAPFWGLAIPVAELEAATTRIAGVLPDVAIVSAADFRDLMNRAYRGLFRFVAGLSALALVAGVVLIANAVGLALVERRRELGVLKAIGYGRAHILSVLSFENGLLGTIGGLAGVGGVYLANFAVNRIQPSAELSIAAPHALLLVIVSCLLAVATALMVSWRTTGLRPLVVLREE